MPRPEGSGRINRLGSYRNLTFRIDDEDRQLLDARAARERLSTGELIRQILHRFLEDVEV